MRAFWFTSVWPFLHDKVWYIGFWMCMGVAARLWLVNPIIRALERHSH